jgi:hypothetical protein
MNVSIKGLDKAEVLIALWKGSHAHGLSLLGSVDAGILDIEKAKHCIEKAKAHGRLYFDYLLCHVIKCYITDDEFDPRLYDRVCGEGRAEEVIKALREGTDIEDEIKPYSDFLRCALDALNQDNG